MMNKPMKLSIWVGLLALLGLSACNYPNATPTADTSGLLYTAAAQTVQVQLTQAASGNFTPLPQVTITPLPPTDTGQPAPTNTSQPPSATSAPATGTVESIPCDRASFVEDVTYPDNSEVAAGSTFVKTWRLKNNGSCTWNSSYSVVFDNGSAMNSPASFQLTTGTVAPGQTVDISVSLKAPDNPGSYEGNWKLRNGGGVVFGIGTNANSAFWVKVKVVAPTTPTPTPTATPIVTVGFDFVAKGPDADWRNGSNPLPWGDPQDDTPGVAVNLDNVKLEDNKTYSKALATYPQHINDGVIIGVFPAYTVQAGDHFRAYLGFRTNCGVGKVRFQLKYMDGGNEVLLGDWLESCDGKVLAVDKDLAGLQGKLVNFVLVVSAEGSSDDDHAIWALPRIERQP
jgi:hypothetical protein